MKSEDIYRHFLTDYKFQVKSEILMKKEQFEVWLRKLFYLNNCLHKEYDFIHQEAFWLVLFQLLTEGRKYLKEILVIIDKLNNSYKREWYNVLEKGLIEIKSKFSDIDFQYLEYRRHNVCHIFQNGYSVFNPDNTIKSKEKQRRKVSDKKSKTFINIEMDFFSILEYYGGDKEYDTHYTTILYPIIDNLYNELQSIHLKEIKNEKY